MSSLWDLTGKVALVTGGSKGIGKAIARELALAGADIIISSRNQAELDAALAEILEDASGRGETIVADMTQRSDVERLGAAALERMGRVDVLVNNAGFNFPERLDEFTLETWDRTLELNLTSCVTLARDLCPQMKERNWGRIIYISSIMALSGKEGRGAYAATKAALVGLVRVQALELGPHGITVNCIAPGPILTDLPRSLLSEEQRSSFSARAALGRWGEPEELGGPALLMASDAGGYITGTTLVVDGGVVCSTF